MLLVLLKQELSTRLVQRHDDQKNDDFSPQRKNWLLKITTKTYHELCKTRVSGRKWKTKHALTSLVEIANFKLPLNWEHLSLKNIVLT